MATPHMQCPACLGHGKFRDNTRCTTCNGTGSVTVAAGKKFIASTKAEAPMPEAKVGRNAKTGNASKGAKRRAKKAGNQSARKVAQATSGKGSAE